MPLFFSKAIHKSQWQASLLEMAQFRGSLAFMWPLSLENVGLAAHFYRWELQPEFFSPMCKLVVSKEENIYYCCRYNMIILRYHLLKLRLPFHSLPVSLRVVLNFWSSYLHLMSTGILDTHHHAWFCAMLGIDPWLYGCWVSVLPVKPPLTPATSFHKLPSCLFPTLLS